MDCLVSCEGTERRSDSDWRVQKLRGRLHHLRNMHGHAWSRLNVGLCSVVRDASDRRCSIVVSSLACAWGMRVRVCTDVSVFGCGFCAGMRTHVFMVCVCP